MKTCSQRAFMEGVEAGSQETRIFYLKRNLVPLDEVASSRRERTSHSRISYTTLMYGVNAI